MQGRNYIEMLSFVGYDKLRRSSLLDYKNPDIPVALIKEYYSGKISRKPIDYLNATFISKYIKNENMIECTHENCEKEGFQVMYEEMLNTPFDEFELFSLMVFNKALFSKSEFGEELGKIRTIQVFLPNSSVDLSEPSFIFEDIEALEGVFNDLKKTAILMREKNDYSKVLDFIRQVVILKCKLIKVHPFMDGNGRSIRCFINRLFVEAGIPPVYLRENEKEDYGFAMNEALRYRNAGDVDDDTKYDMIANFYYHKVCDSIVQLDIVNTMMDPKEDIFRKKP